MPTCANHSWVQTSEACASCRRPLCASCLVDFLGGRHCGPCRDRRLYELQNRGRQPTLQSRPAGDEGLTTRAGLFFLSVVALMAAPVTAAMALTYWLAPGGVGPVAVVLNLAGLAAAAVVGAVGGERLALLGNEGRRREVAEKLKRLGAVQATESGLYVGIAPTEERRAYKGDLNWDDGFLVVEPGWMVYYGEKAQFGLRPDQVTGLEIQPARDRGIMVESRLLLRWWDPASLVGGALRLSVQDFRTRAESRQKLAELKALLESWMAASNPGAGALRLPPAQVAEGTPMKPYEAEPVNSYRQLAILVIIIGGALAAVSSRLFSWFPMALVVILGVLAVLTAVSALVDAIRFPAGKVPTA